LYFFPFHPVSATVSLNIRIIANPGIIHTSQWKGPAIAKVSAAYFVCSGCTNLESCVTWWNNRQ